MMPKKVTVTDLVTIIQEAGKPVTESEIADGAGVSRPTVANRREELEAHEAVEKGKVAGVHTYWASGVVDEDDGDEHPPAGEKADLGSETDDDGGFFSRLFGSPVEVWGLLGITFALGLTVGVSLFLVAAQPPLVVAILAVSVVLAVGLIVTLPLALFYLFTPARARVEEDPA